jgi:hypothetical protein
MDRDILWLLFIFGIIIVVGGLPALFNVIYGSIWFSGQLMEIAIKLFPLELAIFIGWVIYRYFKRRNY